MMYDHTKYQNVNDIFNLCDVPTHPDNITALINTLSDSLGTMAMVNYPYNTSFVMPLPAWPQEYACNMTKTVPVPPIGVANSSIFNFSNIEAL